MGIAKNISATFVLVSILLAPFTSLTPASGTISEFRANDDTGVIYNRLELEELGLDRTIFEKALERYDKLVNVGKTGDCGILSIADLSQPSANKRLYIIDIKSQRLLFNTYVAHGKNTGELYAKKFSNTPESNQSSLGFYVTGDTYNGKHGLSLQLHGIEPGLNDKALDRAIVIHGADYVSEDFIRQTGRLGRSLGCPSIPNELAAPIIETIYGGTLFFVYHPQYN